MPSKKSARTPAKKSAAQALAQSAKDLLAGYEEFLSDLKQRIRSAQIKASLAVNSELIWLYWQIGRGILQRQREQGWGTKVIERLAQDLVREFPEIRGFSRAT